MFATDLGALSPIEMQWLADLAAKAPWREVPGRQYDTADVDYWDVCDRAFFIRIPPKGQIHRHSDAFIEGTTHHLVLKTNDGCTNGWVDEQGQEQSIHMLQGHRYKVERSPIHWAHNNGDTDRIHLLVEF